ncbi:hypothetical protein E2C01_056426 [Portunus trituberculatus]|uniref:Uncharacterized protein n=1 Tax=Portunus trituberculatus TaxID=210409 RepID=A0A5B7GU40_PORTR|nr:hypothetical protein [Portunus trituberculatus]
MNHSENFVEPSDTHVHMQNIERLWKDLKEWTERSGMNSEYFQQNFAWYNLFLTENWQHYHHQFFLTAGQLNKLQSTQQCAAPAPAVPVEDSELNDTRVMDDPQPGPPSSH